MSPANQLIPRPARQPVSACWARGSDSAGGGIEVCVDLCCGAVEERHLANETATGGAQHLHWPHTGHNVISLLLLTAPVLRQFPVVSALCMEYRVQYADYLDVEQFGKRAAYVPVETSVTPQTPDAARVRYQLDQ